MYDVQTALCDVETPLYDSYDVVMVLYYVQASLFDVKMSLYGLHASLYYVIMPLYCVQTS